MLKIRKTLSAAAGLALLAAASTSHAALTLTNTGASIPAYTGTTVVNNTGTTGSLNTDVQYAVFAPGTYPTSMLGVSPATLNPGDYVYAYVVDNLPTTTPSTLGVNIMNVGWSTGAILRNIGHSETLGGNVPLAGQGSAANSFYNFFYIDPIFPGSSSDILLYTSPQAPTFASATVGNGGLNNQLLLPSPAVPEPATVTLIAAVGGLGVLRRRRPTM